MLQCDKKCLYENLYDAYPKKLVCQNDLYSFEKKSSLGDRNFNQCFNKYRKMVKYIYC